jgi:hypothetical protein
MSKRGTKAINGDWENIPNLVFEITEDMIMEFKGKSCNIIGSDGQTVEQLGEGDGEAKREVFAGYQCVVMKARVRFERQSQ